MIGDGVAFAGVAKFPARVKCALLGWTALTDALARAGVDITGAEQDSEVPTNGRNPRSSATPPKRSGGTSRRSAFIGGSVNE